MEINVAGPRWVGERSVRLLPDSSSIQLLCHISSNWLGMGTETDFFVAASVGMKQKFYED